jgi:branched-chain amino acid transport system ATP-binding protein
MLQIKNLIVFYEKVEAIKGINLEVDSGKIVALLGANGAGKTTTLRVISGLVRLSSGQVMFNGQEINKMEPKDIVKEGIAMVPEGRRVFTNLTVQENLLMGAWLQKDNTKKKQSMSQIFSLFPILKDRLKQRAATLSGGEQQMLAIGRALMSKPKLLLMDEPSLGLAPLLVAQLFKTIKEIHEQEKLTILLVEQNVRAALKIADYGYVLEIGKVVLQGSAQKLSNNKEVQKAYIGGK